MSHEYELETTPAVNKFIKKIKKDSHLKTKFYQAFNEIQKDPSNAGVPKTGGLAGIYGYDVYHDGTTYEVSYTVYINDEGKTVLIILAGTRENFYNELKRYIKASGIKPK